jgi:dTDP-4-dehydrorhamnose 3,5-epimerase
VSDRQSYGWIGSGFREQASTQQYGGPKEIDGVRVLDLKMFSDEGGDFCEVSRFSDGGLVDLPEYKPAQISYSYMEPGTIKAWHVHQRQDDVWFIPPHDRLLVGLLDVRESSRSYRTANRLVMGAGRSRLLLIPRGVAHGAANMSSRPASIIYFTNSAFDANEPDEHRLPYDLLGADFWTIRPG